MPHLFKVSFEGREMSKSPLENAKALIKELRKHANRDECYECKRLLRAMGLKVEEGAKT